MKSFPLRKIVQTALWTALVFLATFAVRIASPTGGFFNAGDIMVILGAWLLGPWCGAISAGLGSALADFAGGSLYYVPGTIVIKALMAIIAFFLTKGIEKWRKPSNVENKKNVVGWLVGALVTEIWMVLGYALYAWLILNKAWWLSVPGNLIQGAVGVAGSALLMTALSFIPQIRRKA